MAGCNMAVFENSDLILFTTSLSLPALKNTKRYLTALERKGFRRDRVKLVVTRFLHKADIQVKDAEKVLGVSVFSTIPNDYLEVIASINKGTPVVTYSCIEGDAVWPGEGNLRLDPLFCGWSGSEEAVMIFTFDSSLVPGIPRGSFIPRPPSIKNSVGSMWRISLPDGIGAVPAASITFSMSG